MKIKRAEFIEKWLEALESGEYKQAAGYLRIANGKPKYCCLGVACKVANQYSTVDYFDDDEYDTNNLILPKPLARFIGMEESGGFKEEVECRGKKYVSLAELNDYGVKFPTIARIIREQMEKGNFLKP